MTVSIPLVKCNVPSLYCIQLTAKWHITIAYTYLPPLPATAASLDFSLATYMVDEDSGSVSVCMELSDIPDDGLECDLVVPLDTESGKAGEHALFSKEAWNTYFIAVVFLGQCLMRTSQQILT